jgi:hypothetical protein
VEHTIEFWIDRPVVAGPSLCDRSDGGCESLRRGSDDTIADISSDDLHDLRGCIDRFSVGFSAYRLAKHKVRPLKLMSEIFPVWRQVKSLTITDLIRIIRERIDSAEAMTFEVFMKRIRDLQTKLLMSSYDAKNQASRFSARTVFLNIYRMAGLKPEPDAERAAEDVDPRISTALENSLKPTTGMTNLSISAGAVGTKLWVTPDELTSLVDCGRVDAVRMLLTFISKPQFSLPMIDPTDEKSPYHSIYKLWLDYRNEFPNKVTTEAVPASEGRACRHI